MREECGLGQLELARIAGVTQGQVSNYEQGKAFPGIETLMSLVGYGMILPAFLMLGADGK